MSLRLTPFNQAGCQARFFVGGEGVKVSMVGVDNLLYCVTWPEAGEVASSGLSGAILGRG